jgi:hypothetical protein
MQCVDITNLRSAEYVHDRHRRHKSGNIRTHGRVEVRLRVQCARTGRILGGNEVAVVVIPKRERSERPGNDDVTEAEHREPSLSAERERLRPEDLDGEVQVRRYFDHLVVHE